MCFSNEEHGNKLMTDYFPVRRSSRVPVSKLKEQTRCEVERAVLNNCEDGLDVRLVYCSFNTLPLGVQRYYVCYLCPVTR